VSFEIKFSLNHWKYVHCAVCIMLLALSWHNVCRQVCVSTT